MVVFEEVLSVLKLVEVFIIIWCVFFFATKFVFVLLGKGVMWFDLWFI